MFNAQCSMFNAQCSMLNVIVVPLSGTLSTLMVPPCFRIICRQRLRPIPVPSGLVVKKGMKACSSTSGDIPQPLSRTRSLTPDPGLTPNPSPVGEGDFVGEGSQFSTFNSQLSILNSQFSIELLPALPENWKDGSVSGIRARGGIAVSMTWKDSKVTALTLTAQQPCKVELMFNGKVKTVKLKKGDNKIKC